MRPPTAAGRGRPRDPGVDSAALAATREVLAERGWSGLTMEAVAARVGVAKTTLYRRWPGKADLVVDAVADAFAGFHVEDHGSLEADVRAVVAGYSQLLADSAVRSGLLALLAEAARDPVLAAEVRERLVGRVRQEVAEGCARAAARGELAEDAAVDADLLYDLVGGAVLNRAALEGRAPGSDFLDRLASTVVAVMHLGAAAR